MNLLIIGNDEALVECKARLGNGHQYHHAESVTAGKDRLRQVDAVFDFSEEYVSESIEQYITQSNAVIFLNTVFTTLSKVLNGRNSETPIIGICGLPTFFNREVFEVSLVDKKHREKLDIVSQSLGLKFIVVKDQVGFVTPRVVCMIINEAYDALNNGVASRSDIDLSMKLGTNYPFGPFEWSERIGVDKVKKLLNAVFTETGDNRYKPVI